MVFLRGIFDLRGRYNLIMIMLLEPRISGEEASHVHRRLGKNHWICLEADGFSDWVWLLWNDESIKIKLLNVHKSFIRVAIKSSGDGSWIFTLYTQVRGHTLEKIFGRI